MRKAKYKMGIMGIGLLVCLSINLLAQDFEKDWQQASQVIQKATQLRLEMDIKAYEQQGNKWIDGGEKQLKLYKKGTSIYYSLGEIEVVKTEKVVIMINQTRQQIIRKEVEKPKSIKEEIDLPMGLDSLLNNAQKYKVKFLGNKNGLIQYQLLFEKGEVLKEIKMSFSSKTHYIETIEYFIYSEIHETDIKTEIKIVVFDIQSPIPTAYFEEKNYFIKAKGQWQTTQKYKHYQVISLDDENK